MKCVVYILFLGLVIPNVLFAGTAYIPIWQHGGGVTYMQSVINTDTKDSLCEITLIDTITSVTHASSELVIRQDAWISDTGSWLPSFGFGWGYVTSTGDPGTMYSWGAIYGTVGGKMIGLAVIPPEKGLPGKGYIPIWQHGMGVTYFNNLINADTSSATMTMRLFDLVASATYTTTSTVPPMDAWLSDTADGWYMSAGGGTLPVGFGWGIVEGNGPAGSMFAWGAIYGTLGGKISGLTVLIPESGF